MILRKFRNLLHCLNKFNKSSANTKSQPVDIYLRLDEKETELAEEILKDWWMGLDFREENCWRLPNNAFVKRAASSYRLTPQTVKLDIGMSNLDYKIREVAEKRDPTPEGFQPITKLREPLFSVGKLFRQMDQKNERVFRKYQSLLVEHFTHKHVELEPLLNGGINMDLPEGVICWHCVWFDPKPADDDNYNTSPLLFRESSEFYRKMRSLKKGDYIKIDHYFSSTVNSRWAGSNSYPACQPNIGMNDCDCSKYADCSDCDNAVLRLELLPQKGVYLGGAANRIAAEKCEKAKFHEGELLIPPIDGWRNWKVEGHRDVIFDEHYYEPDEEAGDGSSTPAMRSVCDFKRCHTILLRQVHDSEIPEGNRPLKMTDNT